MQMKQAGDTIGIGVSVASGVTLSGGTTTTTGATTTPTTTPVNPDLNAAGMCNRQLIN